VIDLMRLKLVLRRTRFYLVPRITQLKPRAWAVSPIRTENLQTGDPLAERAGFELLGDFINGPQVIRKRQA